MVVPPGADARGAIEVSKTITNGALSISNFACCLLILLTDDDDYDRRPQRRRYEEPLVARIQRLLFTIAESVRLPLIDIFDWSSLKRCDYTILMSGFVDLGRQKNRGRCRVHRKDGSGKLRG